MGVLQLTSKWVKLTEAQKGVFLVPAPASEGRECGRCCSHRTCQVSCCLQGHLYSSVVPPSVCSGGSYSQHSLLNSGSLMFTKSRDNDFGVKW